VELTSKASILLVVRAVTQVQAVVPAQEVVQVLHQLRLLILRLLQLQVEPAAVVELDPEQTLRRTGTEHVKIMAHHFLVK
jgi:hypothetical protein